MLVESIVLRDFQAHRKLEVTFAPAITTIKGATDAGKSSILRALRWSMLNDLGGDEFIREGTKLVMVTLRTDAGEVVRSKGAGGASNTYALGEEEFKAFGSSVPAPIADKLRVSDINFQGQHDAPFWFSQTAGEVSRRLNAVIDLSVIDTTLANIGVAVRLAMDRKQLTQERLTAVQQQLDDVELQRMRVVQFKALKARHREFKAAELAHAQLKVLLDRIPVIAARARAEKADEAEALLVTARSVRAMEAKIDNLSATIDQAKELEAVKPPPDFATVESAFTLMKNLQAQTARLTALLTTAQQKNKTVDAAWTRHQTAEKVFHQSIKGTRCPLCNSEIQ